MLSALSLQPAVMEAPVPARDTAVPGPARPGSAALWELTFRVAAWKEMSNSCAASLSAGCGDDPGEFSLEDALGPVWPTPKRPSKPAGGTGGRDFDLADYFDNPVEPTNKPARPTARPFPRPGKPDNGFWDVIRTTTTKRPKTTQTPRKQNPGKNPLDLDLADALGDRDDARDGRQPAVRPEEGLSDSDLEGIVDDGYSPDKKKGSGGNTDSQDNRVETGTIAGIASALAMALVGAVSSYISYQQKKFCFSIQQGLNAEYVKGENMEAVVSEEPQVKYSVLETQSAEPPKHDGAKA
ncbi:CD99 antigen-like protein 2 [Lagopus leucura]|uniref:CD99 antigen-like protein 2 n=1 Tax=Lagopus leucura TaxID=30410 RepID=UPI001C684539|nr:CD99 antigen-like protein 2 [Lagopus leucura]